MTVLDLRTVRCPLALVTLKITLKRELLSTTDIDKRSIKLLFSTESAMSDIKSYLDKKSFQYQVINDKNSLSLIIPIKKQGNASC